jgi:enoyl-CoA hydratase/carnithine racemase
MTDSPVLFEELAATNGRRIGVITLNRPRQLNALNLEMCERMLAMLRTWASDTGIAMVILQGAESAGFAPEAMSPRSCAMCAPAAISDSSMAMRSSRSSISWTG